MSGIELQFGFATIPVCSRARAPFTSGTTSGIPSWSRNASDLSTHSAPAAAATGTSSRLAAEPTEKKQTSRSPAASAAGVASSTSRSPTRVPAERADANARTLSWPRSRRSSSVTRPTAPVAPTTAILGSVGMSGVYGARAKSPPKNTEPADPKARRFSRATLWDRGHPTQGGSPPESRNLRKNRHISRRPARARPSVTSSAYSRSPPTGSPLASRVTRTLSRKRSAR